MKKIFILSIALLSLISCGSNKEKPDDPNPPIVNTYTVTFNSDGGTPVAPQKVKEGECAFKPTDPVKESSNDTGYTFKYWSFNDEEFDFTTPIKNDITLLAKYDSFVIETFSLRSLFIENDSKMPRKGKFISSKTHEPFYRSIEPSDINNLPILEINGDLTDISKKNEKEVTTNYLSNEFPFSSKASIKWQGSSSLSYPKKNFNITFLKDNGKKNKVTVKEEWGQQSKYTLKANWVDYSQARNLCSGALYNKIAKTLDIQDEISALDNAAVVDGFPIVIYINNTYEGLYTLNIPKNKWMFGMDEDHGKHEAALAGDLHSESIFLNEPINDTMDNGWELEFCATEETEEGTGWVVKSMNSLISFLNTADDETFKKEISSYTTVGRAIDTFLYTSFICAGDNFAKNIIWLTYDGQHWIPSMYDMDGTWGMMYHGESYYSTTIFLPNEVANQHGTNLLWKRLYKCFYKDIQNRYIELRESVLKISRIKSLFKTFLNQIPDLIRTTDLQRYPDIPRPDLNTFEQISSYAQARLNNFDSFFHY